MLALFAPCALATAMLLGWSTAADASLATLLPPDARILPFAAAGGIAAWLAACCARRPPSAGELDAAALFAGVALPLLAPVGAEAAGLSLALALGGTALTPEPITTGANDDPLPLRAVIRRRATT